MPMTRTQLIRNLKIGAVILAALIIVGYGAWRSLDYARGPSISVFHPEDGSTVASPTVDVIGQVDRVNILSVNGHPVSVDKLGNFKETLIVFSGVNLITLDAKDQFGRATEKQLEVVR